MTDHLNDLVSRFSAALLEKLRAAEKKYGYNDGWMREDWADECREHLRQHLEKGDPRDVAAYCAFLWHHGWSTTDADISLSLACCGDGPCICSPAVSLDSNTRK